MPILEFQCEQCEGTFQELVQNPQRIDGVACEHCGSRRVLRLFSTFAARSSSPGSSSPGSAPGRSATPWAGSGGGCGCGSSCGCH